MKPQYNRRQMLFLAFTAFLAPATRLIPETTAAISGSGSWLVPFVALPFALLYLVFLTYFLNNRRLGEGTAELIVRAVGSRVGHTLLFVIGLYMFFYCGFLLRTGASRFVTTIYSAAEPNPFILTGIILGTLAALGPMKAIVRSAKIFGLFLIAVEVFVLLLSLDGVDLDRLLPVFDPDASALIGGAVPIVNVFVGILAYVSFAEFGSAPETGRTRSYGVWLIWCTLLLTLVTAAIVGSYGAELTSVLVHPFFTLTRGISLLNALERVEAFIVAVWLFPDFIMLSLMMSCGLRCLRLSFGFKPQETERTFSFKNGRALIVLGILAIVLTLLLIPNDAAHLKRFGEETVPLLNFALTLGILPVCCLIGKVRGRI